MTTTTCSTPGCDRRPLPDWAHCDAHLTALLEAHVRLPEPVIPEWRRRIGAKDNTGAVLHR